MKKHHATMTTVEYHPLLPTGIKVKQVLLRFGQIISNDGEAVKTSVQNISCKPLELQIGNTQQSQSEPSNNDDVSAESNRVKKRGQLLALLPVYLLQICYGMNSGFPAVLTAQLREGCSIQGYAQTNSFWLVSLDNFATPLVCIISGFLQQHFGPKKVLVLACLPYTVAWILAAGATSINALYLSRVLVGLSHALLATTVYTVEVTSRSLRGTYSLLESVLRSLGCLIMFSFGFAFRWWQIATFAPIVPILALVSALFSPESPVFLVAKGKEKKALQSLSILYGDEYPVKEELDIINNDLKELQDRQRRKKNVLSVMKRSDVYQPFAIVLLLSFIQQFSGLSVLRAHVVTIFDEVFANDDNSTASSCANQTRMTTHKAYGSAILITLVRLFSSLLLSKLLIKHNRRTMYLSSMTATSLSLAGFATFTWLSHHEAIPPHLEHVMEWSSLAMACVLVFAAQLGLQTLPNLLSGELFSSDVRAWCKGFSRCFTCILIVCSLFCYELLKSVILVHGTFLLFSGILVPFIPLVYYVLPETKDLGLELVQKYFQPVKTVFYVELDTLSSSH